MELALGAPSAMPGPSARTLTDEQFDEGDEADDAALNEVMVAERAAERSVDTMPLTQQSMAYSCDATMWLRHHAQGMDEAGDAVLKEAVATVAWDAHLISAKLHRALLGRAQPDLDADDPIQNDWNGSAKIARLTLERSELAWQAIANASPGSGADGILDRIRSLRRDVEVEFPRAMAFVRPGFDEL